METSIHCNSIDLNDDFSKNLIELLLLNLKVPVYNLTQVQIDYINEFITECPDVIKKVAKDVTDITNDGKIDVNDIPAIIHLIADLYNTANFVKNVSVTKENIVAFIKFTVNVIIESKFVILPKVEKAMIENLINISINLLLMNLGNFEKNSKSFFSFFKVCQ